MSLVRRYRLILGTGLVVFGIRIALRLMSVQQVLHWLSRETPSQRYAQRAIEDAAYYVDRWLAVFPYNQKGNCFPRALTLFFFCCRAGVPVQFKCGVMKLDHRLEGHAWLMLDGREFLEPSSHWQSFTVTVTFPASSESSSTPPSRFS